MGRKIAGQGGFRRGRKGRAGPCGAKHHEINTQSNPETFTEGSP